MAYRHATVRATTELSQLADPGFERSHSIRVSRILRCLWIELTFSAQWGFHPGGWGKPPMDDFNRPLYGDVFGVVQGAEIAVSLRER